MNNKTRVLVWFSCGIASTIALKLAIQKYGRERVTACYCDVLVSEHPDNRRYIADVERVLGTEIVLLSSNKYESIDDVFMSTRYMSGVKGARCTVEMKKVPRFNFQQADDIHIFGLTLEEQDRRIDFKVNNLELTCDWILSDNGFTKEDCKREVELLGIAIPAMYLLGFRE